MDMNRNALGRKPEQAGPEGRARMTAFWGDESWRTAAYRKQPTLFGGEDDVKRGNQDIVDAFKERLKSVAGYEYVPEPLPMCNSTNAVVYYLFFASHNSVGGKIVKDIVNKYKERRA
jgi:three-Cys-motif partner protein